jgi:hypothetical protein
VARDRPGGTGARCADQRVDRDHPGGDSQLHGAGQRRPGKPDRVRSQDLAGLDPAAFQELALPRKHDFWRDVPHLAGTERRPHVLLGLVPVVEPRLGRQSTVSVDAVEVQVEELIHGE